MADTWSMEAFCARQRHDAATSPSILRHANTQAFLSKLGLPELHPICEQNNGISFDEWLRESGVPPMGPVDLGLVEIHEGSYWNAFVTWLYMRVPPLLTFSALWFLLLAAIIAPVGCFYLMYHGGAYNHGNLGIKKKKASDKVPPRISTVCAMTVAASLAMMSDAVYVHDFGIGYTTTLFLLSSVLTFRVSLHFRLRRAFLCLLMLWLIAIAAQFTQPSYLEETVDEGLYYDSRNPLVDRIVSFWTPASRTYSREQGATSWMTTGDARTGLPFFLNKITEKPRWTRVWLSTESSPDEEVLGLDISFPEGGHDPSKPVYLLFHGLSGGSTEGYLLDLTIRRNKEGSTVIAMIARGMMDTPILSWNFFHGGRTTDAHDAARAIRRALDPSQILIGVGYSMGAIVLNNYVATSGSSCALDAAFSISGALDCRYSLTDTRSNLMWQPMLADGLKSRFLLKKHGKKLHERMTNTEFINLMRASSVVEIDRWAAVAYHGYETVESFYAGMSALGDVPMDDYGQNSSLVLAGRKIWNVSIPLLVLHALDDPISTWRTVAALEGQMRPDRLVRSGRGNLMLLLTRVGGHVGWPLGYFPSRRQWAWMSEAAASFADAVRKAKEERDSEICMV